MNLMPGFDIDGIGVRFFFTLSYSDWPWGLLSLLLDEFWGFPGGKDHHCSGELKLLHLIQWALVEFLIESKSWLTFYWGFFLNLRQMSGNLGHICPWAFVPSDKVLGYMLDSPGLIPVFDGCRFFFSPSCSD